MESREEIAPIPAIPILLSANHAHSWARAVSCLTYPDNVEMRRKEEGRLYAYAVARIREETGVEPTYLLRPGPTARPRAIPLTKSMHRRLSQRFLTAHLVMPRVQSQFPAFAEYERETFAERRAAIFKEYGWDEDNFDDRCFRPTLPVLHLACALQWLWFDGNRRGKLVDLETALLDPPVLKRWLQLANELQPLIAVEFRRANGANRLPILIDPLGALAN